MFATRLRWLSITGFGIPDVPELNGRHAMCVAGSMSTVGGFGSVASTSDHAVCPAARGASGSPTTMTSDAASPAWIAPATAWASRAGCVTILDAFVAVNWRAISGAV